MLENIAVVLFRPKFPENIGSVARACLNMGCSELILVDPYNFSFEKALPLATAHGRHLLENVHIVDTLPEALESFTAAYGTTARMGGWRKNILTPATAATQITARVRTGEKIALVFGPEDKGLTNAEVTLCTELLTIPTYKEGVSLNLAQATMVVLYECLKHACNAPQGIESPHQDKKATIAERETLFTTLEKSLLAIDFLKSDNTFNQMHSIRRFFSRINLKRYEFDILMGICRQIRWFTKTNRK